MAEYIPDALRSVFEQTLLPVDVVVCDDAGTDNTVEVVEQFRAKLAGEMRGRLRYERSPVALGIGGNFDRGVRLAEGDLVVKLDADDLLEPDFIEILSKQLESFPQAGWAHCNVLNIHPDGTPIAYAHTRKTSGYYSATAALPAYLRHNDTCHCVIIRKSAYLSVGGYRPQMKTAEDWMLWLEMLFAGWGYVFDGHPLARMRKYEARPELMTRRRQAFVQSAHYMAPRIDELCKQKPIEGLCSQAALRRFRSALAGLCVSSGCDEGDLETRRMLFESAFEFYPSLRNRLWRRLGSSVGEGVTRGLLRWSGLPRQFARKLIQKLR
jgi:hypothetical protein